MKRVAAIILAVVLTLTVGMGAMASVITGAEYIGTVTVTNASTATTNVSVPFTLSTATMISNGYINATASNTAIQINGSDVAYMPAPGATTDWIVWVPSSPAGNTTAQLYTGGGNMTSKIRYLPAAGGMTTLDSPTLELGDNFEVELKGRVDTAAGASKYLIQKSGAFETYVSSAGNITSNIPQTAQTDTVNGAGDATALTSVGAATNWEAVQTNDAGTSCVQTSSAGYVTDYYALTDGTIPAGATIDSVQVTFVIATNNIGEEAYAKPYLRLSGTPQAGIEVHTATTDYSASYTQTITRPGGGSWTGADIAGLQAGISLHSGGVFFARATYVAITVNWSVHVSTAVASGEHTIKTTADTTNLRLYVDGTLKDTAALNGVSVIDNASDYISFQNDAMPYVEYQKITVGGVLEQNVSWENAATFNDQSAGNHDATPTFRTTSSDADVSASLTNFQPIALAEADDSVITGGQNFVNAVPGAIPNMYTEGDTSGLLGLGGLIDPAATTAGIPKEVVWYPIAFAVAIGLGFAAYGWTRQLIIQAVVSAVVMAFFCGGGALGDGLLPYWTVIIFAIEALLLVLIKEKSTI